MSKINVLRWVIFLFAFCVQSISTKSANPEAMALDKNFGVGGMAQQNLRGMLNATQVQADGKILVAGISSKDRHPFLLRYNTNGTPDEAFQTQKTLNKFYGLIVSCALQPDKKIVVAGAYLPHSEKFNRDEPEQHALYLARYNDDGSLDNTFVLDPRVSSTLGMFFSVIVQPDGKIVAVGSGGPSGYGKQILVQLTSSGTIDPEFENNGIMAKLHPGVFFSTTLQPDGRIVAVGSTFNQRVRSTLAYCQQGAMEYHFGEFGGLDNAFLQPYGGLLVNGSSSNNYFIARYTFQGASDPTFGNPENHTIKNNGGERFTTALCQPDGKIIILIQTAPTTFILRRYHRNGKDLDTSFNSNGTAALSLPYGFRARTLALAPDGSLFCSGLTSPTNWGLSGIISTYKFRPFTP